MADFRQQQQQLRPGGQGTAGIFLPGKGASTSQPSFGPCSSCHRAGRAWILNVWCFRGHCTLFALMDGQLYSKLDQRSLATEIGSSENGGHGKRQDKWARKLGRRARLFRARPER
ncbi:hypothetical protein Peur_032262 [Populus x canadensis]